MPVLEEDKNDEDDETPTPLADLLQNFILHVIMASQIPAKIYEKVQDMRPDSPSTGLISDTVRAQEAYNQKKGNKSNIKERNNLYLPPTKVPKLLTLHENQQNSKTHKNRTNLEANHYAILADPMNIYERHAHAVINAAMLRKTQLIHANLK